MSITADDRDARLRRFTGLLRRIGSGCPTPEFREASERVADSLIKNRNPSREDLGRIVILLLDYISRHEAWSWEDPSGSKKKPRGTGKDQEVSKPRGAFVGREVSGSEDMPRMDRDKIQRMREVLGLAAGRVVMGPGGRRVLVPGVGRW